MFGFRCRIVQRSSKHLEVVLSYAEGRLEDACLMSTITVETIKCIILDLRTKVGAISKWQLHP